MVGDSRLAGGPGWYLDRATLLPAIEDEELFRAAHAADPAVDILIALWTGRPEAAEQLIQAQPDASDSARLRALLADAWRDQGRIEDAVAAYEALIGEVVGTESEAVMQQHLGKTLFVAGRFSEAAQAFEKALALRIGSGVEKSLIASSRVAAERAREEASTTH